MFVWLYGVLGLVLLVLWHGSLICCEAIPNQGSLMDNNNVRSWNILNWNIRGLNLDDKCIAISSHFAITVQFTSMHNGDQWKLTRCMAMPGLGKVEFH
jgi:hypothetical protein